MLRNGEANPLAVHGLREMAHCPPHFVRVPFDLKTSNKVVRDWIWENLESRFWFGDWYDVTESGTTTMSACAAFESPGEASMFSLVLDQIQSQSIYL
jgi:hypothetical protein